MIVMADIQWLIGGEAGFGIMTTGALMAKVFTRLGYSVFDYVEYPSLIRGGHNAYYVRASDAEIFSQKRPVDILVAFNRQTIDLHKDELSESAAILYDPAEVKVDPTEFDDKKLVIQIPWVAMAKKQEASKFQINTVALGASLALFYNDYAILQKLMDEQFGKKGKEVIEENINLSKGGFDFVRQKCGAEFLVKVEKLAQENLLIGGAEAAALGAVKAGVKFVAMYPMTPTTSILANIVSHALKYSIVIKEPEDEISAINMAIGASFAGVRSMTATAGGGFALMSEGLGLAAQAETPLVVIEGMRPGPATGMPTWTAQADVRTVLHGGQDEFPRIVIVPGDQLELYGDVMRAFNLAEKYQLQVIVVSDKYLLEGKKTFKNADFRAVTDAYTIDRGKLLKDEEVMGMSDYKRYLLTDDGVSPRSIPGQKGGIALNGSDEHDEHGLYNEESSVRIRMMDKRFKKLDSALADIPKPQFYGWDDAVLTILAFGSTKLPIFEAMKWLKNDKVLVNFLQVAYLSPFPEKEVAAVIKHAKKTLVIENNKTGQFEGLIREHTGLSVDHHLRKYDGRPFYPEEIVDFVRTIV
jgi:2-oxoglutarate ferredoxin oxidoreductase subunit alpha